MDGNIKTALMLQVFYPDNEIVTQTHTNIHVLYAEINSSNTDSSSALDGPFICYKMLQNCNCGNVFWLWILCQFGRNSKQKISHTYRITISQDFKWKSKKINLLAVENRQTFERSMVTPTKGKTTLNFCNWCNVLFHNRWRSREVAEFLTMKENLHRDWTTSDRPGRAVSTWTCGCKPMKSQTLLSANSV